MDLMTLAAKIVLDDSSYRQGIKNAESMGENLKNRMSAMTVAVGNLMADVVRKTVSGINGVVREAVNGYADYQQLIGGVETLFKDSAGRVARYAEQSYKTTGLSANAYMETVTSFSASLLQGLGGDTEAAADIANTAITDMADNANKMGTDISSIQAAYMGFAKQNFQLLDNLKLGYGGTRGEMVRLVNDSKILDHEIKDLDGITFDQLVQAIHVVQTEMGITGTTAKEAAETISGSKATLQASWADFLVSIGGEADQARLNEASKRFQESFTAYVEKNLAPQIQTTISNAPALIKAVSGAITSLPSKAITELVGSGVDLLTATVEGAAQIGDWLIDGLVGLFEGVNADQTKIKELGNAVGEFIGSALSDIVTNAPTIISGLFTAGVSLAGSVIEGLFSGFFGNDSPLEDIGDEMSDSIIEANVNAQKAQGVLKYMESLVNEYGKGVEQTEEFKKAQEELKEYMGEQAGQVFTSYGSDIQGAIDKLRELSQEMRKTAVLDAMRKSINSQYELLGEVGAKLSESEYRRDVAQNLVDTFPETLRQNLAAYAKELQSQVQSTPEGSWIRNLVDMNTLQGFISGEATEGMGIQGMVNQLSSWYDILDEIYNQNGTNASDTLWGKDLTDELYSSDEIDAMNTAIDTAQSTIKTETENMASLQKEYDSILANITVSENALEKQAQKIAEGAENAGSSIETGGTVVQKALNAVAAQIAGAFGPFGGGGVIGFFGNAIANAFMPRDVGIDYVPYSGFKASLHRGEAVITASENEARRSGGTADVVGAIQEMRADLQNLRLVVGQKTFGRAVVDYGGRQTRDYIGQAESRDSAGFGT